MLVTPPLITPVLLDRPLVSPLARPPLIVPALVSAPVLSSPPLRTAPEPLPNRPLFPTRAVEVIVPRLTTAPEPVAVPSPFTTRAAIVCVVPAPTRSVLATPAVGDALTTTVPVPSCWFVCAKTSPRLTVSPPEKVFAPAPARTKTLLAEASALPFCVKPSVLSAVRQCPGERRPHALIGEDAITGAGVGDGARAAQRADDLVSRRYPARRQH